MEKDTVLQYIDQYVIKVWNQKPHTPFTNEEWEACFLTPFSEEEKKKNEAAFNEFMKKVNRGKMDFQSFIKKESFLCVEQYMGQELFDDYLKSMCMFFAQTRAFDPDITVPQIWQALRNYLIYGMVVAMVGEPQSFHEAIMAFSLLYPYTDNYIDNTLISDADKEAFNQMIQNTLNGIEVPVFDSLQERTKKCLHMCLDYRNGDKKELSSKLYLLMLDAQKESTTFMGLTDADYHEKEKEILDMLAYKGGMSVLIDYFLSVPDMKEKGIIFYLQFGFILQLADDIQDIADDRKSKTPTLYSLVATTEEREANLYQLMHFTLQVFNEYASENEKIRQFMLRNCMILYLFAVMRSESFFSEQFKKNIEPYLPFRSEYVKQIGKEFAFNDDMTKEEQQRLFLLIEQLCKETLS